MWEEICKRARTIFKGLKALATHRVVAVSAGVGVEMACVLKIYIALTLINAKKILSEELKFLSR
jgi:uncharacterized linocin/CFP29 family protein